MTDNQGPGHRKRSPAAEEFPACQSCRNRKLKCSRETPSCSQCSRLGELYLWQIWQSPNTFAGCPCAYDRKRQRPGLRSGAIDSLNRRIGRPSMLLLICLVADGRLQTPWRAFWPATMTAKREPRPEESIRTAASTMLLSSLPIRKRGMLATILYPCGEHRHAAAISTASHHCRGTPSTQRDKEIDPRDAELITHISRLTTSPHHCHLSMS